MALVAAAAALVPPFVGSAAVSHAAPDLAGFDIPEGAVVRPLGEVVPGGCDNLVFPGCNPGIAGFMPYTTPGLGVPLGGIGAGSFMINQSGTFGPWYFGGSQSTSYEVRALPQAAFHVREQMGDAPARLRTLAADGPDDEVLPAVRSWEDPLSSWATLDAGQADYAALYPFGWMTYDEGVFATDVAMRFYSPIVAGEAERSSLPVAYFDVQITNDTDQAADVSTMFTMPNVGGHVDRAPATVREGLSSQYREDPSTGIRAVTLSADAESNTPDAYRSEWTIAAEVGEGQTFSYLSSWDAAGDGADVYEEFGDDGRLGDTALDSSASAGAIAVSAQLEPGEQVTIPFALTWDFPQVAFADDHTVWMRRYTEFYGAQTTATNDYVTGSYPFHQSYAIAKDALEGRDAALRDVLAWWEPVVKSPSIPSEVGAAAVNQLANVTFHTNLWENGLVRNSVPVTKGGDRIGAALPDTHNYFGTDSNAGGVSTLGQGGEIGIYSHQVYSELFPFIERDRMRAKVEQILTSDDGDPGDFDVVGSTDPDVYAMGGNPFITWNPHNQSSNNPAPGAGLAPGPGTMSFLDRAAANIYRMYDYAQRNDDQEFLTFAYPAMNRVLGMLQATVPEDSLLPEPTSGSNPQPGNVQQMANVYNAMPTDRFDAYTSGFYLLALESMIEAGKRVGESADQLETWENELEAAKGAYEEVFWNESEGYFRYTLAQSDVDTVMLATLLPQLLAERSGLPDIVDPELYQRHLRSMYPLVAGPNGPKLLGLPSGVTDYPLVGAQGLIYEPNVVPGAAFSAAATYVAAARRFDDTDLRDSGLQLAQSTIAQLWSTPAHGYEFNTPYLYGSGDPARWVYPSFENNLAVWQLVDALTRKPTEPEPEPQPFPQLSLSAPNVRAGEVIHISGSGFPAGAEVVLDVGPDSLSLGPVVADGGGRLSTSWAVPTSMAPGLRRIVASIDGLERASATFSVSGVPDGIAPDGSGSDGAASSINRGDAGLAVTGADQHGLLTAVAAALGLLMTGAAMAVRRRRHHG
jgi:uncharacterized protein (DUF608 family)